MGLPDMRAARHHTQMPAAEVETAALARRYQTGDPKALRLLYARLEVTMLSVLLHYQSSRPPSALTFEQLERQGWVVLAELAQRWRPPLSFLAYFYRSFPTAIARYLH